jgi:hypothetical protein
VGDCAAFWSLRYGRRLRFEHWDVALRAPEVVVANLLGGSTAYNPVPYFWSEQFGRMVQYAGYHGGADRLVLRDDPAGPRWAACWLAGDRLVAAFCVASPPDLLQARRLIQAGAEVDADRLADPAVPVRAAARRLSRPGLSRPGLSRVPPWLIPSVAWSRGLVAWPVPQPGWSLSCAYPRLYGRACPGVVEAGAAERA